jgi:glycosyltransferase involved in cell wall biosynthesis
VRVALLSSAPPRTGAAVSIAKLALGLETQGHGVRRLAVPVGAAGLSAVWRTVRRFQPEAILADQPRDAHLAACATAFRPVPLVYRYNRKEGHRRPRRWDRMVASRLDACVYQSRYAQEQAVAHEPWLASVPAWVVPNGFDTEWFAPAAGDGRDSRARLGLDPDRFLVLTVAALRAGKGQELGIAALGRLKQQGLDVVYMLCGEGPLGPELRARAAAERVELRDLGWLDGQELLDAYHAADLVLHPSDHEILPNAVGEAMSCGCAVVATSVGGTPELVGASGMAGLLVPPRQVEATSRAIGGLLADPPGRKAMGRAARERIRAGFTLSRMVEGVEHALLAAVARPLQPRAGAAY